MKSQKKDGKKQWELPEPAPAPLVPGPAPLLPGAAAPFAGRGATKEGSSASGARMPHCRAMDAAVTGLSPAAESATWTLTASRGRCAWTCVAAACATTAQDPERLKGMQVCKIDLEQAMGRATAPTQPRYHSRGQGS